MSKQSDIDICLILEGTYPFVPGGVSTWVHNLVSNLSDISFAGVCILPSSKEKPQKHYVEPHNFRVEKIIYLHDYDLEPEKSSLTKKLWHRRKQIRSLRTFHTHLIDRGNPRLDKIRDIFRGPKGVRYNAYDMMYGKDAWNLLMELYNPEENDESFIDYFWTYRFTHLPLCKVLQSEIPPARVYHALCTGYAGLLATLAKSEYHRPMMLTEHGIYTKERKIEIAQAEWIYTAGSNRIRVEKELSVFQKIWIKLFEALGKLTYQAADQIITLYDGNRQLQIAEGAKLEKTGIIPNGIDIFAYNSLKPENIRDWREPGAPFNIGFVGRVVPIKDVKTFIRACKIVTLRMTRVNYFIIGPYGEDPEYYQECLELVEMLGLKDVIKFTGRVNMLDFFPNLDMVVLTSISEAQPLVILEANAAGIPVVASDVGSCRELLEGRSEDDKDLGYSGVVSRISDPGDTADGIIKILYDQRLWQQMSNAGRQRTQKYYQEADLTKKYRKIYQYYISQPDRDNHK